MKKLIITLLTLALVIAMAVPASAVTTGKWDFDAGASHAQQTGEDMIQDQETAEELPEDPTEISWRDWIHRWLEWFVTVRE